MTEDKRFYGLYRGRCVDSNDPDDLGRITLQVPQVLGADVTNWAPAVAGSIGQTQYPYGTFSSTGTQLVTGSNITTIAHFDVQEDTNRTALVDGTKLYVYETGDYFFQYSAMFSKTGSSAAQADVWMRKNGVNLPRTNSRVTLQGNPNEVVVTVNYILDLEANDYVEVAFSSSSNAVSLKSYSGLTSPTRPDIPGIIATLNLIGKFKPQPGTAVWVSFLGGDPNFRVWMGAY